MTEFFVRSYPLEDIKITKGGDGRTVEAYAAVFRSQVEIRDQDGHYLEDIDPTAFNRTIQHKGNRFGVFYNHGLTIHGTPSDRGAVPIGTPQEVRVDNVGLRTVTRYNRTALAEEVLEAINTGAITAQSFTGRFVRSQPARVPRRGSKPGELPKVTRTEIDLREYGPTPFPAYADAMITGVRSALGTNPVMDVIKDLLERGELESVRALLGIGAPVPALAYSVDVRAGDAAMSAEDMGRRISELIKAYERGNLPANEPNSSPDAGTPQDPPVTQDTPGPQDPSAGDPGPGAHSARLAIARAARKVRLDALEGKD